MDSWLARSSLPLLLRNKRRKRVCPIMPNYPLWRNRPGDRAVRRSPLRGVRILRAPRGDQPWRGARRARAADREQGPCGGRDRVRRLLSGGWPGFLVASMCVYRNVLIRGLAARSIKRPVCLPCRSLSEFISKSPCDGFLNSSGYPVEDNHRQCEGFDDGAKSWLAA